MVCARAPAWELGIYTLVSTHIFPTCRKAAAPWKRPLVSICCADMQTISLLPAFGRVFIHACMHACSDIPKKRRHACTPSGLCPFPFFAILIVSYFLSLCSIIRATMSRPIPVHRCMHVHTRSPPSQAIAYMQYVVYCDGTSFSAVAAAAHVQLPGLARGWLPRTTLVDLSDVQVGKWPAYSCLQV